MAKKTAAKRARKPAAKKTTKPRKPRALRQPPLEGLPKQVRNVTLDGLCESVADHREAAAKADKGEKSDKAEALKEMVDRGIKNYTNAGITFSLVPGDLKLTVKFKKDTASTNAADDGDAGDDASDQD